jgi:hypothetical protein
MAMPSASFDLAVGFDFDFDVDVVWRLCATRYEAVGFV